MRKLSLLFSLVLFGLIVGCQPMGNAPKLNTTHNTGANVGLAGQSRDYIWKNASLGMTMPEIDRYMGYNERDKLRYFEGLRSRYYWGAPDFEYYLMCFKNDKLVGRNRGECKYVVKELTTWNTVPEEYSYFAEYNRSLSVEINLRELPSLPFELRELRIGGVSVLEQIGSNSNRCTVLRRSPDSEAKRLGSPCFLDVISGNLIHHYNADKYGEKAKLYTKLSDDGISVAELALISNRHNQKVFDRRAFNRLEEDLGEPGYFEEIQVGDSRGRFHKKFIALWRVQDHIIYMSSYGHLSGRSMIIVAPIEKFEEE